MHHTRFARLQRPLFSLLLVVASLAPASAPMVAHAQGEGSLTISPTAGPLGSKFYVHGTGFVNFSLITNQFQLAVFDAANPIVEQASVYANDNGTIDVVIDTADGSYTSGTYYLLASYTYFGVVRDPFTNRIICDFCPRKTVPLADVVAFTIQ